MSIKNIIFDLGGVILTGKSSSVLKEFNIDENTYSELGRFFDDTEKLDLGEESLEEKFYQCDFSEEIEIKYKDILLNYYKYRKINQNLIDLINNLKKNNYKIYILSDNNNESFEYYKSIEALDCIDGWMGSCEYNSRKRDGKLFDILIDTFKLEPSECYFVDDKIINTEEAKKHGIIAYTFNENDSIEKLYDDMRNNSIDIDKK